MNNYIPNQKDMEILTINALKAMTKRMPTSQPALRFTKFG
jgi:hypothetical protein